MAVDSNGANLRSTRARVKRVTEVAPALFIAEAQAVAVDPAGLRLEADAVLDLWRGDDGQTGGDVAAARPGDPGHR